MTPIKFKGSNLIIAEDQPEYIPLPARIFQYSDGTRAAGVCWRLSWRERFKLLFSGKLWHVVYTFGRPLQPQLLSTSRPDMGEQNEKHFGEPTCE